jgi:hypothetical protein
VAVRLSALRPGLPLPTGVFLVLISVRASYPYYNVTGKMQNIEFWFSKLKMKLNAPICQAHLRVTLLLSASSKALLRKINSEQVELPRAHPKKVLTRPDVA